MQKDFIDHAIDVIKGAVGAAVAAAIFAFLQYLGAHIPEIAQASGVVAGGVAGVKMHLG